VGGLALLWAGGEPPRSVFAAVTREVLRHFGNGTARLIRFERDGGAPDVAVEGAMTPADELVAKVRGTGRPAQDGNALGTPIHVDGRVWGMFLVCSEDRLPPDSQARMAEFTELVATAVADAQSRAELVSSRARIVAAADEARRRIERDLHDGAQQRLVALSLRLRTAEAANLPELAADLTTVIDELRELSRGIHPAVLTDSGLRPALAGARGSFRRPGGKVAATGGGRRVLRGLGDGDQRGETRGGVGRGGRRFGRRRHARARRAR
jgi:signal transduction histidine kinase